MGTVYPKTALILIVAGLWLAFSGKTALAQTPTPTPGGVVYVTGDCGEQTISGGAFLDREFLPRWCGVPDGAANIDFHVQVLGFNYSGSLSAWRWAGGVQQDLCTLFFPPIGDRCDIAAGSVDDNFRVRLNNETGEVDVKVWFTAETGYSGGGGATPTPPNFGGDPGYNSPPTAIPNLSLPVVQPLPAPPATPPPPATLALPALPSAGLPATPIATLSPINASIGLSYATPAPLSGTANQTATGAVGTIAGLVGGTRGVVSDVLSYTNSLSATIHDVTIGGADAVTFTTVPSWYAPYTPRPIAQMGWDFESMGQDIRKRYSLAFWGNLAARALALPVQLIKGLYALAQLLGPLGLFLAWLLIMFPIVLVFRLLEWLKNLVFEIFNLILSIIRFIGDLWDMFPGL